MKILLINWAPIHFSEKMGGGVNLYCHDIAIELKRRGHEVVSLTSGLAYDAKSRPYLRRLLEGDIESYQIVNSPIFAPGRENFNFPSFEISNRLFEKVFSSAIDAIRPNVAHFQNIEGFTLSCIEIAKRSGARVVFSLHNYHLLCPETMLLYKDKEVCEDFLRGAKCVTCVHDDEPRVYRLLRKILTPYRSAFRLLMLVRRAHYGLRRAVRPFSLSGPKAAKPSEYLLRRQTAIAALNACDRVLAVSSFVGKLFSSMGVEANVLRVSRIGSNVVKLSEGVSRTPDSFAPGGMVRLAFIGYGYEAKGFHVLLDALKACDAGTLRRVRLTVAGKDMESHATALSNLFGVLAGIESHSSYDRKKLREILKNIDVGVVPPIWWDNAPQVVFEFMAHHVPVIASRIGGIPDFVEHGVNGLLFPAGDASALAAMITRIVKDPSVLSVFSSNIRKQKSIPAHVDELECIYRMRQDVVATSTI